MSDALIISGPDAIAAATYIVQNGLCKAAYDLGAGFDQPAARIYLTDQFVPAGNRLMTTKEWLESFERSRDIDGLFNDVGTNWTIDYDGPPFNDGTGDMPSAQGTQIAGPSDVGVGPP